MNRTLPLLLAATVLSLGSVRAHQSTVAANATGGEASRVITPAENQVWWGYFNESDFETSDHTIGTGAPMALMAAIYVPAGHEQLQGATIRAARVYIASSAVSSLSGLKIWISKELPYKIDNADYSMDATEALSAGINDFRLTTPYEVTGEGFYIGYYVDSSTGYFLRCGGSDAQCSLVVGNPEAGMQWSDLNGNGLGKLAFQILVEGGSFPSDCVTADDFEQRVVLQGQQVSVPVTITNKGLKAVETISYTIATAGGDTTPEESISLGGLAFNESRTVSIPFSSDAEARKYQKTFTITQVDGRPNTSAEDGATGFVITVADRQPVTPVIEEFTGTWCGWCPRGMVGMEKIHAAYGDQVVQIAAHYNDIMAINAYRAVIGTFAGGFPSSITDRQIAADPSYASLERVLRTAFDRVTQGTVGLEAEWETAEQEAVVFRTTTRFAYSDDYGQYGIAFVLVEDGMTGTGSQWSQVNNYNGLGTGGDMAWWYQAGSPATGVTYNHVAVAGWEVRNGVSGSVESRIDAGSEMKYTYTGSISDNTLIQDKSKLKAVCLLIDRSTGVVVNAAQSDIAAATPIGEVWAAGSGIPDEVYCPDGRKLPSVRRGLNIIRMGNGGVKKVLVR